MAFSGVLNKKFWVWLGVVLIISFMVIGTAKIINSRPYPRHIDETLILPLAVKMLQSANFDPGWYKYGTLPAYLSTISMVPGYLAAYLQGDVKTVSEISKNIYPFYSPAEAFLAPRIAFLAFGALGLWLTALIARHFHKKSIYFFLPVFVLLLSESYLSLSWEYVNPNSIGTLGWLVVTLSVLAGYEKKKLFPSVLLPGILTGLTISTKYNFGLVILCPVIYILLEISPLKKKLAWLFLLALVMGCSFILIQPTSVLNFHKFVDSLIFEMRYYSSGHSGYEGVPGLSQVLYYTDHFVAQFGTPLLLFSLLGIFFTFRTNLKRSCAVFLPGFIYFAYMSMQKVHFVRNMLPILPLLAILIAFGLLGSFEQAAHFLGKKINPKYRSAANALLILLVVGLLILPLNKFGFLFNFKVESRSELVQWLNASQFKGSILVADELGIDPRRIANKNIRTFNYLKNTLPEQLTANSLVVVPVFSYNIREAGTPQTAAIIKFNSSFDMFTPLFRSGSSHISPTGDHSPPDPTLLVVEINPGNMDAFRSAITR